MTGHAVELKRPERVRKHSPGLTRSLDFTKEGLAMNATRTPRYTGASIEFASSPAEKCIVDSCLRRKRPSGYCSKHYNNYVRHGSPIAPPKWEPVEPRIWTHVEPTGFCWEWTGRVETTGYGKFSYRGAQVLAHRFVYELLVGPIPSGMQIDHLCHNRACVNPDHLEPVSARINQLRSMSPSGQNVRKTHCPKGHPYDEENTYVTPNGGRQCRACRHARAIAKRKERL